jgi:hypothetical protein
VEDGGSHGRSEDLHWSFQRRREGEDKAVRASGLRVWFCVCACWVPVAFVRFLGCVCFSFSLFLFSFGNSFLSFFWNFRYLYYL